jgi:hypothetical protein
MGIMAEEVAHPAKIVMARRASSVLIILRILPSDWRGWITANRKWGEIVV